MTSRLIRIDLLLPIILLFASTTFAKADLPMPKHYVEDYANVINSNHEHSLNGILQELEQKTGAQYIVLTVQTTGRIPIEQYSIDLAQNWKLGRKGKDDGMLFVIAVADRKYRFEVGYGLEGFITDQYCGRIGRDVLRPYLKKGDYSTGIYEANLHVVKKIATQNSVALTGMPKLKDPPPRQRERLPCCGYLPILFFLFLFFGGMGRRMGWWFVVPFMFNGFGGVGGYGRSGSYGGGSFGGGFGGFGGGMGGGFGGGGASGSW